MTELQKAFKQLYDRQLLLDEANKTIFELEDENDGLQAALNEKNKALIEMKSLIETLNLTALLAMSVDVNSAMLAKDLTSHVNLMSAFGVEGYTKKRKN